MATPVSILVNTFWIARIEKERIKYIVLELFDLRSKGRQVYHDT
ncbi:hypothetical protein [Mesorhizobium silamurunense]